MSDIYARDTEKALSDFGKYFDGIECFLCDEFAEAKNVLFNEVEMLLDQHKERQGEVSDLEVEISELEVKIDELEVKIDELESE